MDIISITGITGITGIIALIFALWMLIGVVLGIVWDIDCDDSRGSFYRMLLVMTVLGGPYITILIIADSWIQRAISTIPKVGPRLRKWIKDDEPE